MKKSLITANEVAERLGIRCQTVYLWIRQKRIPFYRVGRLVKFDEAEVLAHFKAETKKDDSSEKQTGKRLQISRTATIDPRRAVGSNSTLTSEQRQHYKALLKIK